MTPQVQKLPFLDGLRGLLALWVFWGHLSFYCGLRIQGLSAPGWAVDGFMLLSGFLMVYTTRATLRRRLDWHGVRRFYGGRFFRIVPLYYAMLLLGSAMAAQLSAMELGWLTQVYGSAKDAEAFVPDKSGVQSLAGLFWHASFLFGLSPQWSTSSPMPDWSLSLEMQYYLVFPLLWPILKRVRAWAVLVIVAVGGAFAMAYWFGYYAKPGMYAHFHQPSVLLYKLPIFMAGMMLAEQHLKESARPAWLDVSLILVCMVRCNPPVFVFLIAFYALLRAPNSKLAHLMSSAPLRALGDASYAVYLCHFILMAPVLNALLRWLPVSDMSGISRFLVAGVCASAVVLPAAYLLHVFIERPMIAVGKRVLA